MSRRLNLCKGTLFVLGLASLAACGGGVGAPSTTQSTTVSVSAGFTGAGGVTSQITDTSRIVSLSGDITEFLFALGHGDSVVGIDVTTVFPEEAATLPIVGVGRFITAEGVLSQQPTLVIGDTQTAPVAVIDQLRASGITVVILPVPTTFDGLYEKIAQIGSIVGEAEAAGALVDTIARDVESARNDVPTGSEIRVAYIYTRGPDVVLMFGEGMVSPDHSRGRLVGWCRWMVWVVVWRWLADRGVSRVWWCRGAGSGGVGAWLFHGRRSGLERGAGQVRAATCR